MTLILGVSLFARPIFAEEKEADLKAQIEALQKRVENLESAKTKDEKLIPQLQQRSLNQNQFNRSRGGGWEPFEEMERMQEEMNRMFQHSFSHPGFPGSSKGGNV